MNDKTQETRKIKIANRGGENSTKTPQTRKERGK